MTLKRTYNIARGLFPCHQMDSRCFGKFVSVESGTYPIGMFEETIEWSRIIPTPPYRLQANIKIDKVCSLTAEYRIVCFTSAPHPARNLFPCHWIDSRSIGKFVPARLESYPDYPSESSAVQSSGKVKILIRGPYYCPAHSGWLSSQSMAGCGIASSMRKVNFRTSSTSSSG